MIESLISRYGYLAILVGTFLAGETIPVLGGFAAHRGLPWLPGVMACAFIGSAGGRRTLRPRSRTSRRMSCPGVVAVLIGAARAWA